MPLGKLCHERLPMLPIQHQAFLLLTKQGLLSNPAVRGDPLEHSAFKYPLHSVAHINTVSAGLSREQHADTAPGNLAGSSWQEWRVLSAPAASLPSATSTSHRAGKLCFPLWPTSCPCHPPPPFSLTAQAILFQAAKLSFSTADACTDFGSTRNAMHLISFGWYFLSCGLWR